MKLLIAEDDLTSRTILVALAGKWGYEVMAVEDGEAAWKIMQEEDPPRLLLLDWEMPKLDGLALCQRIRQQKTIDPPFIILLTARHNTDDIVAGLEAGANEYIAKPFDNTELQARLQVGRRMVDLQAELSQAMSRQRLAASVFTHTIEGIVITDINGTIIEVNDAFTQITGYSYDEALGKNLRILKSDRQGPEFYVAMWHDLIEKGYWKGEIWNQRKNGELCAEMLTISAVRDAQDKPQHYVALFSDITERKQSEATQAALQKQLQQAQKIEAIGQLTGGIAHDFNNMLASIMGYTELAQEELVQYKDKDIEDYLKEVSRSSKQARDLVAQMLAFSRGGEETLETLMLASSIDESLKMLGSTLPSSIEIELRLDNELAIMSSSVQLHQLIMNLCINARDAMEGKGHITIRSQRVDDLSAECCSCHNKISGDYIQLSVHDTGPGIMTEQLERIFDPFYTSKKLGSVKGSGMGLAMVHGIMHKHGGHILVETGAEKGTTFTLLFPVIEV